MKEIVYIETSFVSLLVASPSRNLVIAGNQQVTRDWWDRRRDSFVCITSEETLREASRGDAGQASLRLAVLARMITLPLSPEVADLAATFLVTGALPAAATSDATHLAAATLAHADYLLTWNCRHLANEQILRRLEREALHRGWKLPNVCTPQGLMGESLYEDGPNS